MAGFYFRNRAQARRPLSPLGASTIAAAAEAGQIAAARGAGDPSAVVRMKIVGSYLYMGWPDVSLLEKSGGPDPGAARRALAQAPHEWSGRILPEIRLLHERLRGFAPRDASPDDVADDITEAQEALERMWTLHFEILTGVVAAPLLVSRFLADAGEADPVGTMVRLVAPCGGEAADLNDALLDLGCDVAADKALAPLVAEGRPDELVHALGQARSVAGERFRVLWPRLAERSQDGLDVFEPTWAEDPSPLQRALAGGPAAAMAARVGRARALAARDALEAKITRRLPQSGEDALRDLLADARAAWGLAETHHYWIDDLGSGITRGIYLRAARHLVDARLLRDAAEVVFLTREEVQQSLAGSLVHPRLVDARRHERELAEASSPSEFIGEPTETVLRHPLVLLLHGLVEPVATASATSPASERVVGHAASSGRVVARARALRGDADLDRVEAGEVLVCESPDTAWTPLLARAGAIVTEVGGLLSHAAIIAREYGIPAVTGARGALSIVRTGQLVEVDGDAGVLTLLPQDKTKNTRR